MRSTRSGKRLAASALALTISVAAAGVPAAGPATAAPRTERQTAVPGPAGPDFAATKHALGNRGCIVLDDLDEFVTFAKPVNSGPDPTQPQIGQIGMYNMTVKDAAGTAIATNAGITLLHDKDAAGHFHNLGDEYVAFSDGTLSAHGTYDLSDTLAGKWISIPITGQTGRYAGKHGVEFFRDIVNPVHFEVAYVLCG